MMENQNKEPWDEAALAASSHSELVQKRSKATTKEEQNVLAPYEHRAFTREAVSENPALALPLAAAIPAYQVSKAAGLEKSRSDPSVKQMTQAYTGIGEGLAQAAKAPWEEAQAAYTDMVQGVKQTAQKAVETVTGLLPWEEAQKKVKRVPQEPQTFPAPDVKFEQVFNKLVQAESRGKHTDASGNLTTSGVGAQGITQVMPKTGKNPGYGVQPVRDNSEAEYLRFGRDYLNAMLKEFEGDYHKALAAYNAGVGNVKKAITKGGENWKEHLPKKSETLPYIDKILGKK